MTEGQLREKVESQLAEHKLALDERQTEKDNRQLELEREQAWREEKERQRLEHVRLEQIKMEEERERGRLEQIRSEEARERERLEHMKKEEERQRYRLEQLRVEEERLREDRTRQERNVKEVGSSYMWLYMWLGIEFCHYHTHIAFRVIFIMSPALIEVANRDLCPCGSVVML